MAIGEIAFVLIYFLITQSIKRTFYWHTLFLLSSLEVSTDLANYKGLIYGYKHFEFPFLPISVSTLLTIFLFVMNILMNGKVKYKKNDLVYKATIIFFLLPLITGTIGILFRDYSITLFLERAMQPLLYLCVYSLLIEHDDKQDFQNLKILLTSALVGSVIASYTGALLGVEASYGAHTTFPANQILWFSPFLIVLSLYVGGKQKSFILLMGILACVNIIFFNATGKAILFVILALLVYSYKNITNIRRFLYFAFIIFAISVGSLIMLDDFFYSLKSNVLFQAKFEQLFSLLNINNWGVNLQNVPFSPKVRVIEAINIFLSQKENLIDLIVGRGFGGYFEDKSNMFSTLDLSKGAFSDNQILTGQFVRPHESFNDIFLMNGVIGIGLWIGLIVEQLKKTLKDKRVSFYSLISLIFIILMWNTYVLLLYFGLIFVYVSKYGESDGN
ncbi:hypothetical protein WMZ97_12440 [Lentibacillus sp. N15]